MVYKPRTTPTIDFYFEFKNGQMGDKNCQMGKTLKGENGQIGKLGYGRI